MTQVATNRWRENGLAERSESHDIKMNLDKLKNSKSVRKKVSDEK